jgi:Carboxypeptidase regulatory-like domain
MTRMLVGLGSFAFLLLLVSTVPPAFAADTRPVALQGTIRSDQEGAMGGVLVSATKAGSTITTTVVSDEQGHYAFLAARLAPGKYDLAIRAVGYEVDGSPNATVRSLPSSPMPNGRWQAEHRRSQAPQSG